MNTLHGALRSQHGYTMIEFVSIMMIIGILSLLVIANSRVGDGRQQLRDAASDYVTLAKLAESMAAASQPVPDASDGNRSKPRKSYGVCIASESASSPCTINGTEPATRYQLFARRGARCANPAAPCLGWSKPDTEVDIVRTITLPKSAVFVANGSATYVDYQPPVPTMEAHSSPGVPVTKHELQIISSKDVGQPCSNPGVYCNTIAMRTAAKVVYVK